MERDYRIIVKCNGDKRGRAYVGLVRDAAGNVRGVKLQPYGRGSATLYGRADALALAAEIERLAPNVSCSVVVNRGN